MTVHQCPECPLLFAHRGELDAHAAADHPHEPLVVPVEAIAVQRRRYDRPARVDERWQGFIRSRVGPPA